MRPFADSDTTVRIAWYPAAPGACHLPYPSTFMSRDWDATFPEDTGPGEVYGASRNYNARRPNPNATGQHICGTPDQFAGQATYDPAVNVQYNRDGIPLCCGAAELPRGGAVVGGRAAVGYTPPAPRSPGGVLIGGTAVVSYSPPVMPGGVLAGGAAVVAYAPPAGGCACEEAIPLTWGVTATGEYCDEGGPTWFGFLVPSAGPARFRFEFNNSAFHQLRIWRGDCSSREEITPIVGFGNFDVTRELVAGPHLMIPFGTTPGTLWIATVGPVT
jgi:hypothetical protein